MKILIKNYLNSFKDIKKVNYNDNVFYIIKSKNRVISIIHLTENILNNNEIIQLIVTYSSLMNDKKIKCNNFKIIALNGYVDHEEALKYEGLNIQIETIEYINNVVNNNTFIDLLPHNKVVVRKILKEFKSNNKACVTQATGTGKSYIAAKMCSLFENEKCLIVTSSRYIVNQFNSSFKELNNIETMTYSKLAYMTNDEISNSKYGLIIFDEFHRAGAKKWSRGASKLIQANINSYILGTSATPIRHLDSGRDMSKEIFGASPINNLDLAEAIARDILPLPKYIGSYYDMNGEKLDYLHSLQEKHKDIQNLKKYTSSLITEINKMNGLTDVFSRNLNEERNFIIFCDCYENLVASREVIEKSFKEAFKNTNINTYTVYSEQSGLNSKLNKFIDKVENNKDNSFNLLFSINMLNEGLHLKNIDGVILLRRTDSLNLYYQQIGRAFSSNSEKTPIIFDLVNNIKLLQMSTFKKAIEDENEVYKRKWKALGLKDSNDKKDIDNYFIYDQSLNILNELEILTENFKFWNMMYSKLIQYKEIHGHCKPSVNYEDKTLYNWTINQRQLYKKNLLTTDKIDKLNEIGFEWLPIQEQWNDKYNILREAYYKNNKNYNLAYKEVYEKLYKWLDLQRKRYRRDVLEQWKIEKLNEVEFEFLPLDTKFENKYKELAKYRKLNGHINVTPTENKELSRWLYKLKPNYQDGKLNQEQIDKLTSLGFDFTIKSRNEELWLRKYNLLVEYKKEFGNISILKDTKYKGELLGLWIRKQRSDYKNNKLSQVRIDLLNKIDFVWAVYDKK